MVLTGRAAAVAALGVVVVLLAPADGWTLVAVAVTLAALVALDLALAPAPRRVTLERGGATTARLGEPVELELVASLEGRRGAQVVVRDAWPPSVTTAPAAHRVRLGPGERRRLVATAVASRRGTRTVDVVAVRTLGPLRVAGRQRNRPLPGRLDVLPPFTSRRHLPEKLARLRDLDGAVVAPVRGQGTEFDSLREYVPGDDVRAIDWRATARRAALVTRTWRPERDRRLVLVLDTGRTAAARVGGAPRLDAAIDAALLLTAVAQRAGDRVDVIAHDVALRLAVATGREANPLETLVRALGPLEPALVETDLDATVGQVLRRVRRRALVVLVTALDQAAVDELLLPALGPLLHRHTVLVASVADPAVSALGAGRGDAERVYGAAAAAATDAAVARVATRLEQQGVLVVLAPPEEFASRLTDGYLALKAAGRL